MFDAYRPSRRGFNAALAVLALCAGTAHAQKIAGPAPGNSLRPQLTVAAGAELPVRLREVAVKSAVNGRLAVSEIALTFYNPNARILEGELQFPLLDGQEVLGFALDVNGRLRDAVPVEKARGQAVFEDITRGRVDPGLLERTQGNNFKLRLYPLPALGVRRVVLRVAETLREKDGRVLWRLPLDYAQALDSFRLDLDVAGVPAPPAAPRGAPAGLVFRPGAGGYQAQVAREHWSGRGVLELALQPAPGAQAWTQRFDGRHYFYAEVPVAAKRAPRALPKTVGLIWDSSGSGAARDHAREFTLLDAYFRRLGDGEVRLTRLRDAVEPVQIFRIVNGDWRALRAALEATPYDGATNLGAFAPQPGVGEYLLISDGLANYGDQPFPALDVPVYTVNAAARSDAALLRRLAEAGGARFIDLVTETPAAAVAKLLDAETRVALLGAEGAGDLQLASPYPAQGRVAVAGVLAGESARLRLAVHQPGGRRGVVEVPVRAGTAPFAMVAALWARLKIEALDAHYELNRAEIRRVGRAFGLVTRETSLIVLERVEDYLRFEIAPPAELAADYERMRAMTARRRDAEKSGHLDNVVRRFQEKISWWKRDFPQGERPQPPEIEKGLTPQDGTRNRADEMARRGAVPPAAAPAVPARQMGREESVAGNRVGRQAAADAAMPASNESRTTSAVIRLKKWQPAAPYAARMREATADAVYRIYLDERPGHLDSTAFFLDAADILFDKQQPALALRVLSNLAEMNLENRHLLRVLGYRLQQAGEAKLAVAVFRTVLALAPEEPQSYRDLGLAYAAERRYQQALDALYDVVATPWHGRFPGVELIALAELNAMVATCGETLDTARIDPRLLVNLPLDLRVVLAWDADNTDIDLWVTDPNGERAYFGNRLTWQGGHMSLDFTGGYGPEEFSLKRAKPGRYRIEAQYFGDRQQKLTGPTTLAVTLSTQFGRAGQQDRAITLRLKGRSETVFVGEFEVK